MALGGAAHASDGTYLPLALRSAFFQAHSLRSCCVFARASHCDMKDQFGPELPPVTQPPRVTPATASVQMTIPILNCIACSLLESVPPPEVPGRRRIQPSDYASANLFPRPVPSAQADRGERIATTKSPAELSPGGACTSVSGCQTFSGPWMSL